MPWFDRICRECYSDPREVHRTLKRRGMDMVTITDHDSIDAGEALRRFSDFFLSEEVTCRMPSGTEVHIAVYDISERQHWQLQARRRDFPAFVAYLREQHLFSSVNHIFSSLTGRRVAADFAWFSTCFPAFEVRNGHVPRCNNNAAAAYAQALGKTGLAGSDAHAVRSLASAYVHVPGSRTKQEFLDGLRAGRVEVGGASGSVWKLTREVLALGECMMREHPLSVLLAPLGALVPLATLSNWVREVYAAQRWGRLTACAAASQQGAWSDCAQPATPHDTRLVG